MNFILIIIIIIIIIIVIVTSIIIKIIFRNISYFERLATLKWTRYLVFFFLLPLLSFPIFLLLSCIYLFLFKCFYVFHSPFSTPVSFSFFLACLQFSLFFQFFFIYFSSSIFLYILPHSSFHIHLHMYNVS